MNEVANKRYMDNLSTLLRAYQSLGYRPLAPVPRNLVEMNRYCIVMHYPGGTHRLVGTYSDHESTIKMLKATRGLHA